MTANEIEAKVIVLLAIRDTLSQMIDDVANHLGETGARNVTNESLRSAQRALETYLGALLLELRSMQ